MSSTLPSLDDQAERWRELNGSSAAAYLRRELETLVTTARQIGLRIEVREVSHACSMGATHEEIIVTPSRDGYQSTT